MPNYCENELCVAGPGIAVSAFLQAVEGIGPIDFTKVIPEPDQLTDGNLCDWRTDHWGTKWNACDGIVLKDDTTTRGRKVTLSFETAWAPPLKVVEELVKKYRLLTFTLRYWEGGMQYQGTFKGSKGTLLKNERKEYKGRRGG